MDKLTITPKTKVFELLENYPQLEDVLISVAPPFKKLKNPVLRKTIAKVATLSQAATIGGLKVEELVNLLRKEAGQDQLSSPIMEQVPYQIAKPQWFNQEKVVEVIDISIMLNAGEQPVHEVLSAIKNLAEGQIVEVRAPFIPAPLLDKSLSLNYRHWLVKQSDTAFTVYFTH